MKNLQKIEPHLIIDLLNSTPLLLFFERSSVKTTALVFKNGHVYGLGYSYLQTDITTLENEQDTLLSFILKAFDNHQYTSSQRPEFHEKVAVFNKDWLLIVENLIEKLPADTSEYDEMKSFYDLYIEDMNTTKLL